MASDEVEEIRAEHRAATRGPWGWVGNADAKSIDLMALRGWGEIVMDLQRWGFQGAQPAFVVDGLIRRASGDDRHPSMFVFPKAHHPWEIMGIDHPDARFIANSWSHVAALLARLDLVEAENAELREAVEQLTMDDYGAVLRRLRDADPTRRLAEVASGWGVVCGAIDWAALRYEAEPSGDYAFDPRNKALWDARVRVERALGGVAGDAPAEEGKG